MTSNSGIKRSRIESPGIFFVSVTTPPQNFMILKSKVSVPPIFCCQHLQCCSNCGWHAMKLFNSEALRSWAFISMWSRRSTTKLAVFFQTSGDMKKWLKSRAKFLSHRFVWQFWMDFRGWGRRYPFFHVHMAIWGRSFLHEAKAVALHPLVFCNVS